MIALHGAASGIIALVTTLAVLGRTNNPFLALAIFFAIVALCYTHAVWIGVLPK